MIPLVKICGIKNAEHVLAAMQAGAAAIGLNFIPPSSRYVGGVAGARSLMVACASMNIQWAGVFVNPLIEELSALHSALGFHVIQLHGDESPDFVRRVKSRAAGAQVWKAFRVATVEDLEEIADYDCDGIVLDAKVKGTRGGTGISFDWSILDGFKRQAPLVLSGGLNPRNVAEAVKRVKPDWVDVASGVENSPGEKSPELIVDFLRAARQECA